jgi:hypothetical protein
LAFYTKNSVLGTTSALLNAKASNQQLAKEITIYLNSSICLLQLLGFVAEVGGAYTTLHGDQVWKYIYVPDFESLPTNIKNKVLEIFHKVGKTDTESLLNRFRNRSPVQRLIDEVSLEMLGLEGWKGRLDELYEAITGELQAML